MTDDIYAQEDTMGRVYGAKYDGDLDVAEIAKLVRADIKAAVKEGELPGKPLRYSVKISRYSMGQSIDVTVRGWEGQTWVTHNCGMNYGRFPEWARCQDRLNGILAAYNHDGSDSLTDYYDVNFASSIDVGNDQWSTGRSPVHVKPVGPGPA